MSSAPLDYENGNVSAWILTYAYFHRREYFINESELLEAIPNKLLQTLPSRDHLIRLAWNLVIGGLLRNGSQVSLSLVITEEEYFNFEKFYNR